MGGRKDLVGLTGRGYHGCATTHTLFGFGKIFRWLEWNDTRCLDSNWNRRKNP